MNLMCR